MLSATGHPAQRTNDLSSLAAHRHETMVEAATEPRAPHRLAATAALVLAEAFAGRLPSPELHQAYDLVGFEPHGVGASTAVEYMNDAGMDALRATPHDLSTDAGRAACAAGAEDFAAACARHTGPLLAQADTTSAARELDIARAGIRDEKLNYLGYFYGTFLGVTYAEACLARPGYPLTGDVDSAPEQVQELLEQAATAPLPTVDGRELTPSLAATGILIALYDDQLWPVLIQALTRMVDEGDGSYLGNYTEAQAAITCLDYPMTEVPAEMAADADRLKKISPTFGNLLAGERPGHTAYGRADACLHEAVDAYLLEGVVPPEGATC